MDPVVLGHHVPALFALLRLWGLKIPVIAWRLGARGSPDVDLDRGQITRTGCKSVSGAERTEGAAGAYCLINLIPLFLAQFTERI